jgi:iduronate 2-sulfatase
MAMILVSLLAGGLVAGLAQQPSSPNPNVLFITVDDLNVHLGRLRLSGEVAQYRCAGAARFERAYCQYPLCNPSRTSFLTGWYPETTQVMNNERWFRLNLPDVEPVSVSYARSGSRPLWLRPAAGEIP